MLLFLWLCPLLALSAVSLAQESPQETDKAFFHRQVEPLLKKYCFACHSHNAGQMESGLALDWRSGWETGGSRGPAILPGNPDASLLIRAVEHSDADFTMPDEKLLSLIPIWPFPPQKKNTPRLPKMHMAILK